MVSYHTEMLERDCDLHCHVTPKQKAVSLNLCDRSYYSLACLSASWMRLWEMSLRL